MIKKPNFRDEHTQKIMELEASTRATLQDSLDIQAEKLRLIQETEILSNDETRKDELNEMKIQILQEILSICQSEKREYGISDKLGYHIRETMLDQTAPTDEQTLIIIACHNKDNLWKFHVQAQPNLIDIDRIKNIKLIEAKK